MGCWFTKLGKSNANDGPTLTNLNLVGPPVSPPPVPLPGNFRFLPIFCNVFLFEISTGDQTYLYCYL